MEVTTCPTMKATIYVGLFDDAQQSYREPSVARRICHQFVDKVGLCVFFTEGQYIYTNGGERGIAVQLINYPRFPTDSTTLYSAAMNLAMRLKSGLAQERVSIVFEGMPNATTVMLGSKDD